MKLSELTIGTEYAIVPSWTYNSRSARDVDSVRENDVVKAELISMDKYEYEPSNRKDNAGSFVKWKALNSAQEAKEREQQETRRKLEAHRAKVQAEVERSTGSIIQTSKELLGVGTYVSVDTEGYDMDYKGVVKLSITEFEALIEMAYAGKDN